MPQISLTESKLFKIWRCLDALEAIQLKKWLISPWCNSSAKLIELHDILCVYYPHFNSDGLNRVAIYQRLFPKRQLDTKLLATLMSLLTKKIEEFLVHQHLKQDMATQQEVLMKVYRNKGMRDQCMVKNKKRADTILAKKTRSWQDLLELSQLYEERYRLSDSRNKALHASESDLLKASQYSNLAYIWRKYRLLLELSEREKILGIDYALDQQLNSLPREAVEHMPVLQLYQEFLKNRNKTNIAHFENLKNLWLQQRQYIDQQDQSILLFYLINIGARIHLQGVKSILSQLLTLYKIGVHENLLTEGNQMTVRTFANIVTTANLEGDFYFVRTLISKHSHTLPMAIQADAVTWAKTHLAFNSKDAQLWKSSLKLQQIGSIKNTFTIRTRVLLIQMWLEDFFSKKEQDGSFMLYFCDAFSLQLKRSKLYGPKRLAAIRIFIKYSRTLIRFKMRNRLEKDKLMKLRAEILAVPEMQAKQWLLEQIGKKLGE